MMRSHPTVAIQQSVQAPTAPSFPILEPIYLLGAAIALDTNHTGPGGAASTASADSSPAG